MAHWENSPPVQVIAGPTAGAMFVNERGAPLVPVRVTDAVAKITERDVKIEYIDGAWGCGAFCLKVKWLSTDPRWQRVQSGEVSPEAAFDIEHRFPRETRTDDMVAYVEHRWGGRNRPADPRAAAQRMMEEAQRLLREADAEQVEVLVEQGTRKILDDTDHQRELRVDGTHETAHAMVTVNDGPKRLL